VCGLLRTFHWYNYFYNTTGKDNGGSGFDIGDLIVKTGLSTGDFSHAGKSKNELIYLLRAYEEALNRNMICSIFDLEGIVLYANRKFLEVSGYTNQELVGHHLQIVNSGLGLPDFSDIMWAKLRKGETWQGEVMNTAKNGSHFWVDAVIIPVPGEDEKTCSYLLLQTLITDQIKTQLETEKKIIPAARVLKPYNGSPDFAGYRIY
jgi:PAS domain S-box-containing protein